jgi:cellulose synthase/poly-beta-1,6-N-acetylglucosamine synthase-like glycosyltransferase
MVPFVNFSQMHIRRNMIKIEIVHKIYYFLSAIFMGIICFIFCWICIAYKMNIKQFFSHIIQQKTQIMFSLYLVFEEKTRFVLS